MAIRGIVLYAVASCVALYAQAPPNAVGAFPGWVRGVACSAVVDGAEQSIAAFSADNAPLVCSNPKAVVSCNFANAEPFDLSAQAWCAGRQPASVPAVQSTVIRADSTLEVRWLSRSADTVETVASRSYPEGDVSLMIAPRTGRLISFRRHNRSPVTVPSDVLRKGGLWQLPSKRLGGEILVVSPGRSQPQTLLAGSQEAVEWAEANARVFALRGLSQGTHDIVPVFAGNVLGIRTSVTVHDGETTIATLDTAKLSDVTVRVETPSWCVAGAEHGEIVLARGSDRGSVGHASLGTGCDATFGGLRAGQYLLKLLIRDALVAQRRFEIGESQSLSLSFGECILAGTVTLNGIPAPGVTLNVGPAGTLPFADDTTVEADAAGQYSMILPGPGRYSVIFKSGWTPMLGQDRVVDVQSGINQKDLALTSGELAVSLENWSRKTPVQITVERVEPTPGLVSGGITANTVDPLPIIIRGLAPGQYLVHAKEAVENGGLMSGKKRVSFDVDHLAKDVSLRLQQYAATLLVVDETGRALSDAAVLTSENIALAPKAPGEFYLQGVSPGDQLYVIAGSRVPICIFAPTDADTKVTLRPGRPVAVRMVDVPRSGDGLSGRIMFEGTQCPVPLRRLRVAEADGGRRFMVDNFPDVSEIWFIRNPFDTTGQWIRTAVPPTGEEVVIK